MNELAVLQNPFRGSIVSTPWESAIDVPSIHRDVFEVCCQAVDDVRARGASAGVLIQGTPGSGKTHLLGRLREHLSQKQASVDLDAPRQAFVWIRLNTNPRWLWRHVRQHFVDDLMQRMPDGLTQLEHLLAGRLAEVADGAGELALWWEYMREDRSAALEDHLDEIAEEARIPSDLMTVLEHWVRRHRRRHCRSWLRGESLPEQVLLSLELVPPQGDVAFDHESLELQAKEIVLSLCRLAGLRMQIVFCFDQIEALQVGLEDRTGLKQFGNVVRDLHDNAHNTLLISCVQADYLSDVRDQIPGYALDSMGSFASQSLTPLLFDEAVALVEARLNTLPELSRMRPPEQDRIWPLTDNDIRDIIGPAGCTPRKLINVCAQRFARLQGSAPQTPAAVDQSLLGMWEERWESAARRSDPTQTEHILADGLPLLVDVAAQEWSTEESAEERDLEFILNGPQGEARVGVSLCNQQNMTSLAGKLRRLKARAERGDLHKLVLIRDERSPISPGARATRRYLDELTADQSGCLLRADAEMIAALDALRELLSDAQAGDLAIGGEAVAPRTLKEWLTRHLASPLREMCGQLTGYPSDDWGEDHALFDQLAELLGQRRIVQLAEASAALDCEPQQLLQLTESDQRRFGLIAGNDPLLFDTAFV